MENNKLQDEQQTNTIDNTARRRKTYNTPVLTRHGTIRDITRGDFPITAQDCDGSPGSGCSLSA